MKRPTRSGRLYDTKRWQRVKRMQLRLHPLCQECELRGKVTAASIVHHTVPHRNNRALFFTGPLMSLCASCHDGVMQQREKRGFSTSIGRDGWPLDEKHPVYRHGKPHLAIKPSHT